MTEKQYRDAISEAARTLGVHRVEFSRTRVRLAQIYMRIEELEKARQRGDFDTTTVSVSRNGETEVIDPHIIELDCLYDKALAHEKALGLTADAARKIREDIFAPPKQEDPFAAMLHSAGVVIPDG